MSQPATPSTELLSVSRRFFRAIRERDAATLRNLLSESEHLRFVGSAEDELWSGRAVREGLARHYEEAPRFTDEEIFAEAFEAGNFGWSLFVRSLHIEGMERPAVFRVSLVFALEGGVWRIMQRHASTPRPNLELHGVEHTALDALAAQVREAGPAGLRGGLTAVMFTDIAESTALAAEVGDRAWAGRVRGHFEAVARIVDANDGQMLKSLGDGTMSAFASAGRALAAAAAIQRHVAADDAPPPLSLRVGVHCGDVVGADRDVFGAVVNKAARIAASAPPGTVRVSDLTRALAGTPEGLRFGEPFALLLRGFPGEQMVHELIWRD